MPCISSCPECHRDLTIPDALDADSRLRCPLCEGEFTAERVLADAVPFPPAAIELATVAGEGESTAADRPESAFATANDQSAANAMAAIDAADDAAAEDGSSLETEAPASEPATLKVRSKTRAKASAFGFLGQLAGMAFGGVLGLALGYYILLWIGGPQADFLEVRSKLPGWMLPPNRPARDVDRPGRRRRGMAHRDLGNERNLGELLNEPDEPVDSGGEEEAARPTSALPAEAVPASFEQPTDPSGGAAASPGDAARALAEAEMLQRLPPESAGEDVSSVRVGPQNFKAYSMDELEAALAKVGAALGCERCHGAGYVLEETPARTGSPRLPAPEPRRVRCSRCGGKPAAGLSAEAFDRLCTLADAVTFAQLAPDDEGRDRLRQQILSALMLVGSDRGKTQIVGRLAGARLEDSQRMSNGIALAGTVQEAGQVGPLYRTKLVLFGVPKSIVVLSRQAPLPPLAPHDRVLILGSIVDSPIKNLAGYSGNLTQVVWGGLPMKLLPGQP